MRSPTGCSAARQRASFGTMRPQVRILPPRLKEAPDHCVSGASYLIIPAMKFCPLCKTTKPLEEFHRSSKNKDGRQSYCKACRKGVDATIYAEGGEEYKQRKRTRQRQIVHRNTRLIYEYLCEHPCFDCGEADPLVLEFDHVRGEKRRNVTDFARTYGSWETIRAEIEKCEVRCANCHRRRTVIGRGDGRYLLDLERRSRS